MFKRLRQNRIINSIIILAGGTAFAQFLGIAALPLLTRLYTPTDFSVLAVYSSLLVLLGSVACLRYEIAIALPENDEEAKNLLCLSLASTFIFAVIVSILISFDAELITSLIKQPAFKDYLWLLPIGICFLGCYNALQYWQIRNKQFKIIAKTKLTQSLSSIVIQFSTVFLSHSPLGLILGQISSSSAGIVSLSKHCMSRSFFKDINFKSLKKTAVTYKNFPKFSTWEALTNNGSMQIPVLIIAAYAIGPEAGYLMLATKIFSAPVSLLGSSIAQVYLSEAAEAYRTQKLYSLTVTITKNLFKIGFPILSLIGCLAPFLMPIVFGINWEKTGWIMAWMTPWFIMQFITSPVSMSLHITGNQKLALQLQLFGFLLRTTSVIIAAFYYQQWLTPIYAISGFIFYCIYLIAVLRITKVS